MTDNRLKLRAGAFNETRRHIIEQTMMGGPLRPALLPVPLGYLMSIPVRPLRPCRLPQFLLLTGRIAARLFFKSHFNGGAVVSLCVYVSPVRASPIDVTF